MTTPTKSRWTSNRIYVSERTYEEINGAQCVITIEPRNSYCDRGNWVAKIFPREQLAMEIDGQDGWPRFYMDLDRAKLEIEDWMKKRGQWV